jgi:hypothetical protein
VSTMKGVTARVAHFCAFCQMHASEDAVPVIQPGHRYIRSVAFPGDEGVTGTRPVVIACCIACQTEVDDFTPVQYGACGTFCHGTIPCSLPFQKGSPSHDHACRVCVVLDDDLRALVTGSSASGAP